jgi:hypothetical protein
MNTPNDVFTPAVSLEKTQSVLSRGVDCTIGDGEQNHDALSLVVSKSTI